ncbi:MULTISPECIES: hypothetical protein [unclassified Nonomuraea]|uniref:hypothetical protein n=1 Tax=unclassified Nonomuraea TaxID=2593643 RepID=UPI0033DF6875
MNPLKIRPVGGVIVFCFSLIYMVTTLPGPTASTAAAIRWAGLGLAFMLGGILVMLSGILAVLIERSSNATPVSGGDTRLQEDRRHEVIEP